MVVLRLLLLVVDRENFRFSAHHRQLGEFGEFSPRTVVVLLRQVVGKSTGRLISKRNGRKCMKNTHLRLRSENGRYLSKKDFIVDITDYIPQPKPSYTLGISGAPRRRAERREIQKAHDAGSLEL